jgi:RHS repeat-associated protein
VTTFSHSGLKNAGAQTDAPASGDPGIQSAREYDAFGSATASSGSWSGPFGYAGQFVYQSSAPSDPLGGLHLLGHRYYDPSTGRFLTRDPVGDGSNWYAYCGSSPLARSDPWGLEWHDPSIVRVDPEFRGRVIAYGDFPWMKRDGWRRTEVLPGFETHPDMDVDLIEIRHDDGRSEWVFLPGVGIPKDGIEDRGVYYVDSKGGGHGPPPSYKKLPIPPFGVGFWHPNPPFRVGAGAWLPIWSDWITDGRGKGFPRGYEPRRSAPKGRSRSWLGF